jgi:GTP:adenosylcobinamide-phosphate guanylyltransferase
MMTSPLTLIFPMAGEGARFGYRFKPFLDVRGMPFIKAAVAPFRPWRQRIDRICFVFTRAQEDAHDVSTRLGSLFPDLPVEVAILEAPTPGPAETLRQALVLGGITGPAIVCDCDHAVDIEDLMAAASDPAITCAVPTWSLEGESLSAWSVAAVDAHGRIRAIREKAQPEHGGACRGVIGCYYFSDIGAMGAIIAQDRLVYLSDLVAKAIGSGGQVQSCPARWAEFFGDPARLAACEENAQRAHA